MMPTPLYFTKKSTFVLAGQGEGYSFLGISLFYVPARITKVVTVKNSICAVVGVVLEDLFFNVQRQFTAITTVTYLAFSYYTHRYSNKEKIIYAYSGASINGPSQKRTLTNARIDAFNTKQPPR